MTTHDVSHFQTTLVVDTTAKDETRIALIKGGKISQLKKPARAQELQKMIDELLEKSSITLSDLRSVAVLTGPGSFTGTRIGATAANTLRWLYNIPLIDIPGTDFEQALKDLTANKQFTVTRTVLPRY